MKNLLILMTSLGLSACAYYPGHHYVHDRSMEYLQESASVSAVSLPVSAQSPSFLELYPVPAASTKASTPPSLWPPGSLATAIRTAKKTPQGDS